jgi:hypothetical protein
VDDGWKLDDPGRRRRVLTDRRGERTQLDYLYTEVAPVLAASSRSPPRRPAGRRHAQHRQHRCRRRHADLIINSYHLEGAGTSVTLFPNRSSAGFSVAGDDICCVAGHVLPPISWRCAPPA